MAGTVNRVILIGNVGKDPEIRTPQDGSKIANITIATSETWNDRQTGERKEKTEWHRISVLNSKVAEVVENYVKKGSKIYVDGALQTRKWTDQSGQERFTTEVVIGRFKGELTMLDSRNADNGGQRQAPARSQRPQGGSQQWGVPQADPDISDEIPF